MILTLSTPWEKASQIGAPSTVLQRAGHATAVWNERIYLFGGRRGNSRSSSTDFLTDVWCFDTRRNSWSCIGDKSPFSPRAYHTATVIDGRIYIIGGTNDVAIFGDVWVFDCATKKFHQPSLRDVSSPSSATLQRTAHASCISPIDDHAILIYGGYGKEHGNSEPGWLGDIIQLDTITNKVTSLNPLGPTPIPRGYHSFTAAPGKGHYCYAIGGRSKSNKLLSGRDIVSIFDPVKCRWLNPPAIGGLEFDPRSSHRAVAVDILTNKNEDIQGIFVFGGAGSPGVGSHTNNGGSGSKNAAPGSSSKASYRFKDLHFLQIPDKFHGVGAKPLKWIKCQPADCFGGGGDHDDNNNNNARAALLQANNNTRSHKQKSSSINTNTRSIGPSARSAHTMEMIGDQLFVIAGYGDGKQYVPDAWCISLEDATVVSSSLLQNPHGDDDMHNNNNHSNKMAIVVPQTNEPIETNTVVAVNTNGRKKRRLQTAAAGIVNEEEDDEEEDGGGNTNHPYQQQQQEWKTTKRHTRGNGVYGTAPVDTLVAAGGVDTRRRRRTAAADAGGTTKEAEGLLTEAMLLRMRNATAIAPPMEDLQHDLQQAQDRIAALQAQLQQSTRLVGTLQADKGGLEIELANADTKWRTAVRDAMEWKDVADQARKETRLLQSKARQEVAEEMQHNLLELKRQNDILTMTLQTREAMFKENVSNLEAKNQELAQVKIDSKRIFDEQRKRDEEYSKQVNALREQAKVHNDRTQADIKKIESLEKQLEKERAANASIRRDHAEERSKLKAEHSKEKARAENLETELEELKRNVHMSEQEHKAAKRQLEEAVTERAEAERLVGKLKEDREKLQVELQQVKSVMNMLKGYEMSDVQDLTSALERISAGAQLVSKVVARHKAGNGKTMSGVGGGGSEGGAGTSLAGAAKRAAQ